MSSTRTGSHGDRHHRSEAGRSGAAGAGVDAGDLEPQLLARLGLDRRAGDDEVVQRHEELVAFLESAPDDLQSWAHRELAQVDAIMALLGSPTATRGRTRARRIASPAASAPSRLRADDAEEILEEYEREEPRHRRLDGRRAVPRRRRVPRRGLVTALAVAGVVAVGFGVYHMNGGSSLPGISGAPDTSGTKAAASATPPPLDTAKVAQLMAKLKTDPKDVTTLLGLGNAYYAAGDYANAVKWMDQVVAIDPKNVTALLAIGASDLNLGQVAAAEAPLIKVTTIDPNNAEAYYDLGFLYLSESPPDLAKVKADWEKVVAINPNSDMARTVSSHLAQLTSATPAPSAGG